MKHVFRNPKISSSNAPMGVARPRFSQELSRQLQPLVEFHFLRRLPALVSPQGWGQLLPAVVQKWTEMGDGWGAFEGNVLGDGVSLFSGKGIYLCDGLCVWSFWHHRKEWKAFGQKGYDALGWVWSEYWSLDHVPACILCGNQKKDWDCDIYTCLNTYICILLYIVYVQSLSNND